MTDRLTTYFGLALMLVVGVAQIVSCGMYRCDDPEPIDAGEFTLVLDSSLNPDYADLVGAQLVIDRDTETSTIRYTRDGTTYEVQHSLTKL